MAAFIQKLIAFFMTILAFFGIGRGTAKVPENGYQVNGSQVVVCLTANPSTGYSWEVGIRGDSVKLSGSYFEQKKTQSQVALAGAGGLEYFTLTAVKPGDATVTLTYQRSWETDPPIRTVTVVLTADEALNLTVTSFTDV